MHISESHTKFIRIGVIGVVVIAVVILLFIGAPRQGGNGEVKEVALMTATEKEGVYEPAKELTNIHGFINTPEGTTLSEFIGKQVILVDFWTYSCINCQRTLPYINDWWDTYKDKGLVILGVHTPEFTFEEKLANVQVAVNKYKIGYPVFLDNDYATWNAYDNHFWPRKYLIDIDGYIVYDHIGEGGYEETEMKIQELLAERAERLGLEMDANVAIETPLGVDVVDSSQVGSPEVYFGGSRNEYLGNGISGKLGIQTFTAPQTSVLNILYLQGSWNITDEYAENKSTEAKIIFKYKAKKVHFVGSSQDGVHLRILQDGKEVNQIDVQVDDLYTLINDDSYGEHILEIIVEDPGLNAFTFTFG